MGCRILLLLIDSIRGCRLPPVPEKRPRIGPDVHVLLLMDGNFNSLRDLIDPTLCLSKRDLANATPPRAKHCGNRANSDGVNTLLRHAHQSRAKAKDIANRASDR